MKAPLFIERINWSDLREQKRLLLETINNNNVSPEHKEGLEGILSLIDAVQDYAVDEMDVREIDVFDFDIEDERENQVCTSGLFVGDIDYSKLSGKNTKTLWLCPDCNSDNVQFKTWTDANSMKATDDEHPMEDEDCWCKDCKQHVELYTAELKTDAKVIGFQVVGEDGTPEHGDIHPRMKGSFCVYNLSQAKEMLNDKHNQSSAHDSHWQLLTIWSGDIEEPTMMFKGDPRD